MVWYEDIEEEDVACEAAVSMFMQWEMMEGKEEEDVACEAAVKAERHRLCTAFKAMFNQEDEEET